VKRPHKHDYKGSGIICDCPSETINISFEVTHDKLLAWIDSMEMRYKDEEPRRNALLAVVELHKPRQHCSSLNCWSFVCVACNPVKLVNDVMWPCPTIEAIEKELQ